MTWLLESTVGKVAVFFVDLLCGLTSKAFHYFDGDNDE